MALKVSKNFSVGNRLFPAWFNAVFKPYNQALFPFPLSENAAGKFVNDVSKFTGKAEVSLNELIAHFCIVYNETGGRFASIREQGSGLAYFFQGVPNGKVSYNAFAGNELAGNQLKSWKIISDPKDVAAWNGTKFPIAPQAVYNAAVNCDFYKYRGGGMNQLTGRTNYKTFAAPAIKEVLGKDVLTMSDAELTAALQDERVYYGILKAYTAYKPSAMAQADKNNFYDYGLLVSNWAWYATNLYSPRCKALVTALTKA